MANPALFIYHERVMPQIQYHPIARLYKTQEHSPGTYHSTKEVPKQLN